MQESNGNAEIVQEGEGSIQMGRGNYSEQRSRPIFPFIWACNTLCLLFYVFLVVAG